MRLTGFVLWPLVYPAHNINTHRGQSRAFSSQGNVWQGAAFVRNAASGNAVRGAVSSCRRPSGRSTTLTVLSPRAHQPRALTPPVFPAGERLQTQPSEAPHQGNSILGNSLRPPPLAELRQCAQTRIAARPPRGTRTPPWKPPLPVPLQPPWGPGIPIAHQPPGVPEGREPPPPGGTK